MDLRTNLIISFLQTTHDTRKGTVAKHEMQTSLTYDVYLTKYKDMCFMPVYSEIIYCRLNN
jgi:hypothetical protein